MSHLLKGFLNRAEVGHSVIDNRDGHAEIVGGICGVG
jgi:hypothetical protein